MNVLLRLAILFGGLSLLAVGGGNAVLPDMQHAAVARHWMSEREFLDLFALSRIAPGPGSLIVTLIGQKVAGVPGAVVATLAMFVPSCLLVHMAARLWHRLRDASWRGIAERGLAPIGVGLTYAAALVLIRGTEHDASAYAITAVSTVLLSATNLHPLLVLGAGAVVGWAIGI
jgi:chromate transporter